MRIPNLSDVTNLARGLSQIATAVLFILSAGKRLSPKLGTDPITIPLAVTAFFAFGALPARRAQKESDRITRTIQPEYQQQIDELRELNQALQQLLPNHECASIPTHTPEQAISHLGTIQTGYNVSVGILLIAFLSDSIKLVLDLYYKDDNEFAAKSVSFLSNSTPALTILAAVVDMALNYAYEGVSAKLSAIMLELKSKISELSRITPTQNSDATLGEVVAVNRGKANLKKAISVVFDKELKAFQAREISKIQRVQQGIKDKLQDELRKLDPLISLLRDTVPEEAAGRRDAVIQALSDQEQYPVIGYLLDVSLNEIEEGAHGKQEQEEEKQSLDNVSTSKLLSMLSSKTLEDGCDELVENDERLLQAKLTSIESEYYQVLEATLGNVQDNPGQILKEIDYSGVLHARFSVYALTRGEEDQSVVHHQGTEGSVSSGSSEGVEQQPLLSSARQIQGRM